MHLACRSFAFSVRAATLAAVILAALSCLFGCSGKGGKTGTSIAKLKTLCGRDSKLVRIHGKVKAANDYEVLGLSAFQIWDGSDAIWVASKKSAPPVGETVTVRGLTESLKAHEARATREDNPIEGLLAVGLQFKVGACLFVDESLARELGIRGDGPKAAAKLKKAAPKSTARTSRKALVVGSTDRPGNGQALIQSVDKALRSSGARGLEGIIPTQTDWMAWGLAGAEDRTKSEKYATKVRHKWAQCVEKVGSTSLVFVSSSGGEPRLEKRMTLTPPHVEYKDIEIVYKIENAHIIVDIDNPFEVNGRLYAAGVSCNIDN